MTAVFVAGPSRADPLPIDTFGQLALRCGPDVAPLTLAAIARAESRFQPLMINDNTTRTTGAPATREIAAQVATKLIAAGHSVDVGLMQINSANFRRLGLTPDAALDPCRSIAAAATMLVGDYAGGDTHVAQQAALRAAISDYNTGSAQRGFENGYVHKVELAAQQVVPALDVSTTSVAPDQSQPSLQAVNAGTSPGWDVWASAGADADASHRASVLATDESGSAILADAVPGSIAAAKTDGSSNER